MRIYNLVPVGFSDYKPTVPYRRELGEMVHHEKYDMSKYRSHEAIQEFIRGLREKSKPSYPLKPGIS